jgi:hypothetical protein
VNWPVPQPGLVIRYSYLWEREALEGREEGVKDRPCAIVLVLLGESGGAPLVRVLPISNRLVQRTAAVIGGQSHGHRAMPLQGRRRKCRLHASLLAMAISTRLTLGRRNKARADWMRGKGDRGDNKGSTRDHRWTGALALGRRPRMRRC